MVQQNSFHSTLLQSTTTDVNQITIQAFANMYKIKILLSFGNYTSTVVPSVDDYATCLHLNVQNGTDGVVFNVKKFQSATDELIEKIKDMSDEEFVREMTAISDELKNLV